MTKSKKFYNLLKSSSFCHESSKTSHQIEYSLYEHRVCGLCKEKTLPEAYLFMIRTTTAIIRTSMEEQIRLIPICVGNGCVVHDLFESLSYDDRLYFLARADNVIYEIDIFRALSIYSSVFNTNIRGNNPIPYGTTNKVLTDVTNINGYLIPVFQSQDELIRRKKETPPKVPIKKFKLYNEVKTQGDNKNGDLRKRH